MEFICCQDISVEHHKKDKTLYNLAVTLLKHEEQEVAVNKIFELDSSFNDEFYEKLAQQMGFPIYNLNEGENSKHRKEVSEYSEK